MNTPPSLKHQNLPALELHNNSSHFRRTLNTGEDNSTRVPAGTSALFKKPTGCNHDRSGCRQFNVPQHNAFPMQITTQLVERNHLKSKLFRVFAFPGAIEEIPQSVCRADARAALINGNNIRQSFLMSRYKFYLPSLPSKTTTTRCRHSRLMFYLPKMSVKITCHDVVAVFVFRTSLIIVPGV